MALSKKKKSPIEVKLVIRENSNKDTTFNKVFIYIYMNGLLDVHVYYVIHAIETSLS